MLNSFPRRGGDASDSVDCPLPPAKEARYRCVENSFLLILLYLGLNKSQKQWGLVNKSVANHANGSAIGWIISVT